MRNYAYILLLIHGVSTLSNLSLYTILSDYYCAEKFVYFYTDEKSGIHLCIREPKKTATFQEAIDICLKLDSQLATEDFLSYAIDQNKTSSRELLYWFRPVEKSKNDTFGSPVFPGHNQLISRDKNNYLSFICMKQSKCSINWRKSHVAHFDMEDRDFYHSRCCSFLDSVFEYKLENVTVSDCLTICQENTWCELLDWQTNQTDNEHLANGTCYLSKEPADKFYKGEVGTFCAYRKKKPHVHTTKDIYEEPNQICRNYSMRLQDYTKCFTLHTKKVFYSEAKLLCEDQLATLVTEDDYALISKALLGTATQMAWVSLEIDPSGNWSWLYKNEYKQLTYGEWENDWKNVREMYRRYPLEDEQIRKNNKIQALVFADVNDRKPVFLQAPGFAKNHYLCETVSVVIDEKATRNQKQLISYGAGILVVGAVLLAVWIRKLYRSNQAQQISLTHLYNRLNKEVKVNPYTKGLPVLPLDQCVDQLNFNRGFEIDPDRIELGDWLGSGTFGVVHRGYLKQRGQVVTNYENSKLAIAIKSPSKSGDKKAYKMLVDEIIIMSSIGKHSNVLSFVGASTKALNTTMKKPDLFMVLEYCENGNLKNFLEPYKRKEKLFINELRFEVPTENGDYVALKNEKLHKYAHEKNNEWGAEAEEERLLSNSASLMTSDLICFALQIAEGMNFIANVPCVHRDLAARNILVTYNNICKVADFGFAKDTKDKDYCRAGEDDRLPIRWMPIEAIETPHLFTTESDVWSYGVLLFELFSLGAYPYSCIGSTSSLLDHLKRGYRLPRPDYCHEEIYDLMKTCWDEKPSERPTFAACSEKMQKHLKRASPQLAERIQIKLAKEMERLNNLSSWTSTTDVATTQV